VGERLRVSSPTTALEPVCLSALASGIRKRIWHHVSDFSAEGPITLVGVAAAIVADEAALLDAYLLSWWGTCCSCLSTKVSQAITASENCVTA